MKIEKLQELVDVKRGEDIRNIHLFKLQITVDCFESILKWQSNKKCFNMFESIFLVVQNCFEMLQILNNCNRYFSYNFRHN